MYVSRLVRLAHAPAPAGEGRVDPVRQQEVVGEPAHRRVARGGERLAERAQRRAVRLADEHGLGAYRGRERLRGRAFGRRPRGGVLGGVLGGARRQQSGGGEEDQGAAG
jgi:hypothetical protein